MEGWFKWVVGTLVALLVGGSGIVALLTWVFPEHGKTKECFLAGTVFDSSNRPFPGTAVGFENASNEFTFLGASLPDGRYDGSCEESPKDRVKLLMARAEWDGCIVPPDSPKEVTWDKHETLNVRAPTSAQCTRKVPITQLKEILIAPTPRPDTKPTPVILQPITIAPVPIDTRR